MTEQYTTLDSYVQILPIEGNEWRVECKETENNPQTVELIDGVLTVKQEGNVRKWYEYIGIFNAFQSPSVTVYLPVQVYESLEIHSTSGSIKLEGEYTFSNAILNNVSGSIEFDRCDAASFDLETTSGGIRGSILSAKVFDCHSTSGGVRTPENGEGGIFKARTTSGGIRITIVE